jgi:hypothetical protein
MNWNKVPAGEIQGATNRLWTAFGDSADMIASHINTDPKFTEEIRRFTIGKCFNPSESHERARKIMGKNFFGVDDAIKYFGVNPTLKDLRAFEHLPWNEDFLTKKKNSYVLTAQFPIPLLAIHELHTDEFTFSVVNNRNWGDEDFAHESGEIGWQLIRKNPIANHLTWEEQLKLVGEMEGVPKAAEMVYAMIGYRLKTGNILFKNTLARCSDKTSLDGRVVVGWDNKRRPTCPGIDIDRYLSENAAVAGIGLALSIG